MTEMANPLATRRFTADGVWKMVEIGLLGEDEPYDRRGASDPAPIALTVVATAGCRRPGAPM